MDDKNLDSFPQKNITPPIPHHLQKMENGTLAEMDEFIEQYIKGGRYVDQINKIMSMGGWKREELNLKRMKILCYYIDTFSWNDCAIYSKQLHQHYYPEQIAVGCSVEVREKENQMTMLMMRARDGDLMGCKLLMESGCQINSRDRLNRSALWWAVYCDEGDIVLLFLNDPNIEINTRDKYGKTPLHQAFVRNNEEIINILIGSNRINFDVVDGEGKTYLMQAVIGDKHDIAERLIRGNADLNIQDNEGRTALMWAVSTRSLVMVKMLRGWMANKWIRENKGRTPLMMAFELGYTEIASELTKN